MSKLRDKEVKNEKTGEVWIESRVVTFENHLQEKLLHIGSFVLGGMKDLDLGKHDLTNFPNREHNDMPLEKQGRVEQFFAIQKKHEAIKVIVKACTTHEELDAISWSGFNG